MDFFVTLRENPTSTKRNTFLLCAIIFIMYSFIYRMSWYDSSRHTKSHTNMYFLDPRHTYWGHDDPLCRIELIRVRTDTPEYKSAVSNSKIDQEKIDNGIYEFDEFFDEDTIISNVVCNLCKNTLPPHSIKRHLNIDDKIHKCPHDEFDECIR